MPTKEKSSLPSGDNFWLGLVAWLVLVPTYALKEADGWAMYRCVLGACIATGLIGLHGFHLRRTQAATTPRKQGETRIVLYVCIGLILAIAVLHPLLLILLLGAYGACEVLKHLQNYRQLGVFVVGSAGVMTAAVALLG